MMNVHIFIAFAVGLLIGGISGVLTTAIISVSKMNHSEEKDCDKD